MFFADMASLQLMLFCLILVGMIMKKANVIRAEGQKALSDLLLNAVLPCNIVHSFMGGVQASGEFVRNCVWMFFLSVGIQLAAIYGSRMLFFKYQKAQKNVLSYGIICSNSSFIGLPVAETLFGDLGVMYTSVFQIPIRFTMWTAGLSLFTDVDKKDAFRKIIRHPCIVAILIGVLVMVSPWPLPGVLNRSLQSVSQCTTPLSMFIIGSILADAPVRSLFSRTVFYYTFLRLIAFPVLVYLILLPLQMDQMLCGICLLMTGMPAGSTTSILANQYGGDAALASEITFTSTLFSITTIPLLACFL